MEHGGLYESTNFSCVAENEAGRTTKRIQVIVTGKALCAKLLLLLVANTTTWYFTYR